MLTNPELEQLVQDNDAIQAKLLNGYRLVQVGADTSKS